MKVYFIYDGKDTGGRVVDKELTEVYKVKIDIPTKWLSGPCDQLLRFVVGTYNKKSPAKPLVIDDLCMCCGSVELKPSDIVESRIHEYNEVSIRHVAKSSKEEPPPGALLCTNFGCGQYFMPDENTDTACHHHAKEPVFHDIVKYWKCCPGRRAHDWDEFKAITPCCTSRHGTENKVVSFNSAPVTNTPLTVEQTRTSAVAESEAPAENIAPRRTTGPREFEGAANREPQTIVDGKARCSNFGCGKEFVVSENSPTACQHHTGAPVFWDTYRYWNCCPGKRCIDFDDFVKVPGCSVGPHNL